MDKKLLCFALLLGAMSIAEAADTPNTSAPDSLPLKYSTSLSLQYREVKISSATDPYENHGTTATAGISRKLDPTTSIGLSLSYSLNDATSSNSAMTGRMSGGAATAYVAHYIGHGRVVSAAVGYGISTITSNGIAANYRANADNLVASVGISQLIPISKNFNATIGLGYGHVLSHTDGYTTGNGTNVGGSSINSDALSVFGALQWKLGRWSPNLSLGLSDVSSDMSLSNGDNTSIAYGLGLGYDMGRDRSLNFSYVGTAGLKNVQDKSFGVSLSLPM